MQHRRLVTIMAAFMLLGTALAQQARITVWHQEQPPHRVERFERLASEFNAANPAYHVDIQVRDWNTAYQTLAVAAAAGRAPDVMFVIPDFALTVRQLGIAQPVTALVQELDALHDFVQPAIDPYFVDGEFWAVPLYGMLQVLWYRKDMFAAAGITSAPTTWGELVSAAAALTGSGKFGIAVPAGRNLASDQVIYSIMLTSGAGDMFDESCDVTFDTPETIRALELYAELLRFSPPDATSYSWGEPQALFNAGTTAMAIEKGQYLMPFVEESGRPADDLGMVRIPVPETGGHDGTIYYSNAAMVFTSDPAKQAAAHAFLSYLLSTDVYGDFLTAEPGLFLPLTQSGLQAESLWSHPVVAQYREYVEEMLAYSANGALFGFTSGNVCAEITAISQQNLLAQVVQQMATGGMTAAQAAAWGQARMEEAVQDFRQ